MWSLFLICAFPLHVWALLLIFGDLSWISERTNSWDAIGVASYGLIFTFFESVIYFLAMALLGFLVSRKWDESRRIALLSSLSLVLSLWAVMGQVFFYTGYSIPRPLILFIARSGHPVRLLYGVLTILVLITFITPTALVLKNDGFKQMIDAMIERLSVLVWFYLFLDFLGLLVVLFRNLI
jgi:hypothetical protein